MKLLFPGSFDPITLGHMDLIERGAKIADELYVVSFDNAAKQYLLEKSQRVELMRKATAHLKNVVVDASDGLQVQYCQQHGIDCVLRGLRNELDFLYERDVAVANHRLGENRDAVFARRQGSAYQLQRCQELIAFSADLSGFVPDCVKEFILSNS